jgi:Ca2+-binding RTX toxin-like protein
MPDLDHDFDPTLFGGGEAEPDFSHLDDRSEPEPAEADLLLSAGGEPGTEAGEVIEGTARADRLEGRAGDDLLLGLAGSDTLDGGEGVDFMLGGAGNDTYYADRLEDVIIEAEGEGRDTVLAASTFVLADNLENLTLVGRDAADAFGNALGNVLTGNDSDNEMHAGEGADRLVGGGGADRLHGGADADQMLGGAGDDTYFVTETGDRVIEAADEGHDTVEATVSHTLAANIEDLVLAGEAAINGAGNAAANTLTGNAAANRLDGRDGDDHLIGAQGEDTLVGGDGADTLDGGYGQDLLNGGEGDDLLLGDDEADTISGGAGNDTLDGGAGADRLVGGVGDDIYRVNDGGDVVVEAAGGGIDTVILEGAEFKLSAHVENLVMQGPVATRAYGNDLANRITGNDGGNILEGGRGDDTLEGGGGWDWLVGGEGADVFVFGVGFGSDDVRDFEVGVDRVQIADGLGAFTLAHVGADTVLTFADGSEITFAGVRLEGDGWLV